MTFQYNSDLVNLESLLQRNEKVQLCDTIGNGNFFYNDYLIEAYYQIQVIDFDYLSLPCNDNQIELLLNKFSNYIVASKSNDISKGRICEIPSSSVIISGRLFESEMQVIENVCKEKLGITSDFEIITKLSKMVIYEKDCPTLPIVPTTIILDSNNSNNNSNNDNNSNNIFATLVLVLPSTKPKGCDEFLLKYNNLVLSLNIPNVSASNLRFFVFYNDCFNKMKSITNSYRVCLVYDLIKVNSKTILSAKQLNINKEKQIEFRKQLKVLLKPLEYEFNLVFSKLEKLIYVLDQKYQSFNQILRNSNNSSSKDKIVTEKILLLKKKLGYSVYLTNFVYEESSPSSSSSNTHSSYNNFQQNHQTSILYNFLDENDLSPITLFGIENYIHTNEILPINCLNNINAEEKITQNSILTKSYKASSLVIIKNKTLPPLPSSPKKINHNNNNNSNSNNNNDNYNNNGNIENTNKYKKSKIK